MSRATFYQLICVILLIVFIGFSLSSDKEITKSAEEIAQEITAVLDTENLTAFGEGRLEEEFGFDADSFESWAYYGNEDVMDVREIIVIKLNEGAQAEEILSVIEERADEKYNTFRDYDPEASSVLKNRVTEYKNGVVFYVAHKDSAEGAEAFLKSVDE